MLIQLFNLFSRLIPSKTKLRLKEIFGAIVFDVAAERFESVEKTVRRLQARLDSLQAELQRKKEMRLAEYFYENLQTLDPDAGNLISQMTELSGVISSLRTLYPPTIRRITSFRRKPKISVLIPVYSNHDAFRLLLDHLNSRTSFRDFEVIVINDCPSEPLDPALVSFDWNFGCTFLEHPFNLGFGPAINAGANYAIGEYIVAINSDILPLVDDWLEQMLQTFSAHPNVAMVGAKTRYENTNVIEHFGMYPIRDPISGLWKNAHYFDHLDDVLPEMALDQETDMVTGAVFLIPTSLFRQFHGLDQAYLIGGYEDADLCRRLRSDGYRIRVCAKAVFSHSKSASTKRSSLYSEEIHLCNVLFYNARWREYLDGLESRRSIHHEIRRPEKKTRVLFVAHGYPPEDIGGTELYNKNLALAVSRLPGFESIVLARRILSGPSPDDGKIVWDPSANEIPVFRCLRYEVSMENCHFRTELEFELFLNSVRPDVVHFNHTVCLSTNMIQIAKRCTSGPVIYTLNEFLPICANFGLMLKNDGTRCETAEPQKCADCVQVHSSFIEKRTALYRQNFSYVDLFLAPSQQLRERFLQWGLAEQKIRYCRYGMSVLTNGHATQPRPVRRFTYIGMVFEQKGILVLLRAAELLNQEGITGFEIHLHGLKRNYSARFNEAFSFYLERLQGIVTFHGGYDPSDLSKVLSEADVIVVPSLWWENSPLTIQEAFMAGVPVIASNIGGMKELVTDGVYGLLFEAGSERDLADKMKILLEQPALAEKICQNQSEWPLKTIDQNAQECASIYQSFLEARDQ